jgi:drug/metabolite transporter (DMT)-like permease
MRSKDLFDLLMLAAVWGASFMFMRLAVVDLHGMAIAWWRVLVGAALLMALVAWQRGFAPVRALDRKGWYGLAVIGVVGTALPFALFGVASSSLSAGTMAIINATTPLWGAVFAAAWLGERLSASRIAGLLVGMAGVVWLSWDQSRGAAVSGQLAPWVAMLVCLMAPVAYGFTATFAKKFAPKLAPLTTATLTTSFATLALTGPAWTQGSMAPVSSVAFASVLALGVLCTGFAYVLYFRLIANVGATNATTVTFLIPLFAVFWGKVVLNEPFTVSMAVACATIVLGTALSTGWLQGHWKRKTRVL